MLTELLHDTKVDDVARNETVEPKIVRNDPCPCGSGLKYKRGHGK